MPSLNPKQLLEAPPAGTEAQFATSHLDQTPMGSEGRFPNGPAIMAHFMSRLKSEYQGEPYRTICQLAEGYTSASPAITHGVYLDRLDKEGKVRLQRASITARADIPEEDRKYAQILPTFSSAGDYFPSTHPGKLLTFARVLFDDPSIMFARCVVEKVSSTGCAALYVDAGK